jgi:hypothetical protein
MVFDTILRLLSKTFFKVFTFWYAALAQLVEQRFCKAKVLSSSLRSGSKIIKSDTIFVSLFIIYKDYENKQRINKTIFSTLRWT